MYFFSQSSPKTFKFYFSSISVLRYPRGHGWFAVCVYEGGPKHVACLSHRWSLTYGAAKIPVILVD